MCAHPRDQTKSPASVYFGGISLQRWEFLRLPCCLGYGREVWLSGKDLLQDVFSRFGWSRRSVPVAGREGPGVLPHVGPTHDRTLLTVQQALVLDAQFVFVGDWWQCRHSTFFQWPSLSRVEYVSPTQSNVTRRIIFASVITPSAATPASLRDGVARCFTICASSTSLRA